MGTKTIYRLRKTNLRGKNSRQKQGNLITKFGQPDFLGIVAQMVERSLCMREVRGSIPRISKSTIFTNNCRNSGNCGVIPTETNKPEAKKLEETRQLDYQVWATGSYGDVAQMVERSLSMREVRGSRPRFSNSIILQTTVGTLGSVKLYRLRQTILGQRIQTKQDNLITKFGQRDKMGM